MIVETCDSGFAVYELTAFDGIMDAINDDVNIVQFTYTDMDTTDGQ